MPSRYPKTRRWGFPKWYTIDRVRPEDGELLGSLHAEYKRCGKANCRCASGDESDLHGPYYYRRWRDEDGTQQKEYVPEDELETVHAGIEKRRRRLRKEREERAEWMNRGGGNGHPRDHWKRKNRKESTADALRSLLDALRQ
jgi:hypothetical protein